MSSEMNPFGFLPPGLDLSTLFSGSSGPINWEIAKYFATAMAGDGDGPQRWSDIESNYDDLVRAAEVQVQQYSLLSSPELLTPVEVVSRARWAELHLDSFRPMLEPLAKKMAAAQSQAPAPPGMAPFANLMQSMTPMMMGAQAGMLVGFLSHHVLGRYDLQLPPTTGPKLVFCAPNLEDAERELNVVPRDFAFYVVLREVVRAIEYQQPGVPERFVELAAALVDTLELDPEKLAALGAIDPMDPSSIERMMEDPSGLLGAVDSPAQREAMEQMTAWVELVEGYADHVLEAVGAHSVPTIAEIDAAVRAKGSEDDHGMEDLFEQALGFGVRRGKAEVGRAFCDRVVAVEGVTALNRVWRDDASKPSLAELEHPDDWLARTIGRRG